MTYTYKVMVEVTIDAPSESEAYDEAYQQFRDYDAVEIEFLDTNEVDYDDN